MTDDRFRALVRDALALQLAQMGRTHEAVHGLTALQMAHGTALVRLDEQVRSIGSNVDAIRSAREQITPPLGLPRP